MASKMMRKAHAAALANQVAAAPDNENATDDEYQDSEEQ